MRRIVAAGLLALAAAVVVPAAAAAAAVHAPAVVTPAAVPAAASPKHMLFDISCVSAKDCVAVGLDVSTDRPVADRWNGRTWAAADLKLPRGATIGQLNVVSCAAANHCLAAGLTGDTQIAGTQAAWAPLAESWNGSAWSASRPPSPSGAHGAQLDGISCPSARTCIMTGVYNLANRKIASFADVLRGGRWTVYKPPGMQNTGRWSVLNNVSCASAVRCVAVGSYGIYGSPGGSTAGTVVAESWNGAQWSQSKLPMPSGAQYGWLYDVSCVPSGACAATGGRYLPGNTATTTLAETLTAGKWTATTPYATGSEPALFAVSCVSAASCLAVGGGDATTAHNGAFSDSWNGSSWKFVRLPVPSGGGYPNTSLADGVSCASPADCLAIGYAGPVKLPAQGFSGLWNGKSWRLLGTA